MVTAYDYPSAVHVDRAGMDIVLVGDSCAMVELGFETTQVRVYAALDVEIIYIYRKENSLFLLHQYDPPLSVASLSCQII